MNLKDIQKSVADIEACKADDEEAHSMEDDLMKEFIKHVSISEAGEISEMAKEVLKTGEIKFNRWCA